MFKNKPVKFISLLVVAFGVGLMWVFRDAQPIVRLTVASAGLLFFVKVAALVWQWSEGRVIKSKVGFVLFLFAWPGVLIDGFEDRSEPVDSTGRRFLESWVTMMAGFGLLVTAAIVGRGQSLAMNYLALVSVLLIVHLGFVEVWTDGLRLSGFQPKTLFDRPFKSKSLREFWGQRWNLAFVDMNKLFVLAPFKGKAPRVVLIFAIFLFSGVLHELAISYPDGVSWGLPLSYFALQGLGVLFERKLKFPRVLVWLWVIAPVPLLFTPAFMNLFLGSACAAIFHFISGITRTEFIQDGLIVGGIMQLIVLGASLQVPGQLDWRNEFQRLRPLNRKVAWTYGGYILSTIIFMAFVSFYLAVTHGAQAGGGKLWLVYISIFWWARILIDFFYMKPSDWPEGPLFRVGHVCLSTLFMTMVITYSALAIAVIAL